VYRIATLRFKHQTLKRNDGVDAAPDIFLTFASGRSAGFVGGLPLPMPIQILAGVLLLDFSTGYLAHRIMQHSYGL
jgi:hypothetical protein